MKFIDLFAGIGGFRTGLEKNGHECVAFCEIDKYARQSYKAIYDTEGEEEWHDITQVSNNDFRSFRGRADIITGGFPCQAFSIAGKRRGFEDTRGTLFFEIARAIKEIEPSYALLENVKGLFSHDKGRTFGTIIQALDELGYIVEWGLFNSKYWGVPQNRERVFILATRKDIFRQPKLINLLNKQTEVNTKLIDILESEVDEKYFLSDERVDQLKFKDKVQKGDIKQVAQYDTERRENSNRFRTYDIEGIGPGLSTMGGGGLEPCVIVDRQGVVIIPKEDSNFYTKDNIVVTEEVFHEDPFEYDYEYINAEFRQIGEYYLLINQDGTQAEVLIKLKEGVYETVRIIHDLDEVTNLEIITPKDGSGRMGEQAIETFIINSCEPGDTINAYNRTVDKSGISPTLTTRPEGFKTAVLLITGEEQDDVLSGVYTNASKDFQRPPLKGLSRTLKADNHDAGITDGFRIRKLTPLECWRLQGFTDEQFYKAKNDGVSNSQLYKQAGNSVTVNVIDEIARELI